MSAQYQTPFNTEAKEDEGMLAIQAIEATVQDIMRRNGFSAEASAEQMVRFARGYAELYMPLRSTTAVQQKIQTMVDSLLKETCLTTDEINDLILMVNL